MNIKITAIVPKMLLKNINVQNALARKQMEKTVPELTEMFEGTVRGWEDRPTFGHDQTVNSEKVGVYVGPKGEFGGSNKEYNIYRMVSLGAEPHAIPKTPFVRKWLRFRMGYIPATRPGDLTSTTPKYTGPWTKARWVSHPGFKGRNFNETIAKKYEDTFEKDMQDALSEVYKNQWG